MIKVVVDLGIIAGGIYLILYFVRKKARRKIRKT
jgi:hypothetical protein